MKLLELLRVGQGILFWRQDRYQPPSHRTSGTRSGIKHVPDRLLEELGQLVGEVPHDLNPTDIILKLTTRASLEWWREVLQAEVARVDGLLTAQQERTGGSR
jgi:hypothetical protein